MDPVTAAILGGGLLLQWFGSRNAANASRNAAQTQQNAVNQSANLQQETNQDLLNFYREMWQQAQQQQAPYVAMGHNALGMLAPMMGMPGLPGVGDPSRGGLKTLQGTRAGAMPSGPGLGPLGMMGAPQGTYSAPQMVTMIAPTGEQQQVPITMVRHYEARGARRA